MPTLPRGARERQRHFTGWNTYPDRFRLLLDVRIDTPEGITTEEQTVAVGRCRLRDVGGGAEGLTAGALAWVTPFAVDLPFSLDITPANRIEIEGRTFEVGSVSKAEWAATEQTAIVQLHSTTELEA